MAFFTDAVPVAARVPMEASSTAVSDVAASGAAAFTTRSFVAINTGKALACEIAASARRRRLPVADSCGTSTAGASDRLIASGFTGTGSDAEADSPLAHAVASVGADAAVGAFDMGAREASECVRMRRWKCSSRRRQRATRSCF
jgi:hypothetical protein